MICTNCGHKLEENTKFCPQCGTPVEASVENQAETSAVDSVASAEPDTSVGPAEAETPAESIHESVAADFSEGKTQVLHTMQADDKTVPMHTIGADSAGVPFSADQSGQQDQPASSPQFAQAQTAQSAQPTQFEKSTRHLASELFDTARLKVMAIAGGIGLASAVVATIVTMILLALAGASSVESGLSQIAPSFGDIPLDVDLRSGILSVFGVLFAGGVGGGIRGTVAAMGGYGSATVVMPVMLSGLCLLVGSAFAAFMWGKSLRRTHKWTNLCAALITGAGVGLAYLVIAVICAVRISGSFGNQSQISGATPTTFFMALLLTFCGVWAGLALAEKLGSEKNVFTAAWTWTRRARGFVRTVVEASVIYALVFTVVALVVFILAAVNAKSAAALFTFPVVLPMLAAWLHAFASFGVISTSGSAMGSSAQQSVSLFAASSNNALVWVLFAVFIVVSIYIMLRMIVRNAYDAQYINWKYSWQAPLIIGVAWIVLSFIGLRISVSAHAIGQDMQMSIGIAPWYGVIAAAWIFALEAGARVFSRSLSSVARALWPLVASAAVVADGVAYASQNNEQTVVGEQTVGNEQGANNEVPASATVQDSQPTTSMAATPGTEQTQDTTPLASVSSAATPEQFASQINATTQPSKPMDPKVKRGIIAGTVVVALVVALAAAFNILSTTVFSAKAVAQSYIQAVESGDYDRATQMSNLGLTSKQSVLLTSAVGKKAKARISGATLGSETKNADGSRTYQVSYNFQGNNETSVITVKPTGKQYGVFDAWKITGGLVQDISLSADKAIDEVTVGGVKVSLHSDESDDYGISYKVYPGVYEVVYEGSQYIKDFSAQVKSGDGVNIRAKATEKLKDDIAAQAKAKIDECAKSTSPSVEGCPFSSYISEDSDRYRNFSWSITKYPTVRGVDLYDGTFYLSGGEAKLSYELKSFFDDDDWEDYSSEVSIYSYGTFVLKGDSLTVSFDED